MWHYKEYNVEEQLFPKLVDSLCVIQLKEHCKFLPCFPLSEMSIHFDLENSAISCFVHLVNENWPTELFSYWHDVVQHSNIAHCTALLLWWY